MDTYFKILGVVSVGVILCLILSQKAKDYSAILTILLCCIICAAAAAFIKPILELLDRLGALIEKSDSWMPIILKSVGLAYIGETVCTICTDTGHASVGKSLQMLTTVAILWVSLPLMEGLLELIQSILEMI
ncbi:MAG: hypothetical protein IJB02_01215 [Oscillospiraceae bacterium]|nr:hypothetical protein [Oscillospiraceae bacterium]